MHEQTTACKCHFKLTEIINKFVCTVFKTFKRFFRSIERFEKLFVRFKKSFVLLIRRPIEEAQLFHCAVMNSL